MDSPDTRFLVSPESNKRVIDENENPVLASVKVVVARKMHHCIFTCFDIHLPVQVFYFLNRLHSHVLYCDFFGFVYCNWKNVHVILKKIKDIFI